MGGEWVSNSLLILFTHSPPSFVLTLPISPFTSVTFLTFQRWGWVIECVHVCVERGRDIHKVCSLSVLLEEYSPMMYLLKFGQCIFHLMEIYQSPLTLLCFPFTIQWFIGCRYPSAPYPMYQYPILHRRTSTMRWRQNKFVFPLVRLDFCCLRH